MKSTWLRVFFPACLFIIPSFLFAQDKPALASQTAASLSTYDVNREVTLVGTVVAYASSSKTLPAGPRVSLQTSSGLVDIHLGDARLLAANQFTVQPGDTLRIVGENISLSGRSQFVARIVQKGSQALLLRTQRGFPISSSAPRATANSAKQGSAL
jgi:hypothetical protein